jgi:hypothetical protein
MYGPGISSLIEPIMVVRLKGGTLLDEYTRPCLAIRVERQITAAQVHLDKAFFRFLLFFTRIRYRRFIAKYHA